ncbi:MAG TPA: hypothetical protein DD791_11785 [Syntrophomonas sp.]|nr:hypothetical protein [Syntrophomonas sp.]
MTRDIIKNRVGSYKYDLSAVKLQIIMKTTHTTRRILVTELRHSRNHSLAIKEFEKKRENCLNLINGSLFLFIESFCK